MEQQLPPGKQWERDLIARWTEKVTQNVEKYVTEPVRDYYAVILDFNTGF